uniref:TRIM8/14/16/25/29/45/65 coiled-coil region domain-containing protein n=1 Tax=Oryzias latipes TaxID=8090 RepID=A0A3B3HX76_ORYLA
MRHISCLHQSVVFTFSTPCGHNFCKNAITQLWDVILPCECPLCKETHHTRPELKVNTLLLSQMVSWFSLEVPQKANRSSQQQAAKAGEVPCDICIGTRLKALKSFLVCLLSYCEIPLEPHLTASRLKKHQLTEPKENLEDRICTKHEKPLESHDILPLKEESEAKKAKLVTTETGIMLQMREMKLQEIKKTVLGVEILTALKESMERALTTKEKAKDLIKALEPEIAGLKRKISVMKQLLESEDHLDFLETFSALNPSPPTKDWTSAVTAKIGTFLTEGELNIVKKFAVDVTVDPQTAKSFLVLSYDRKRVHSVQKVRNVPNEQSREIFPLLGKSNFEVEVKGQPFWFIQESAEKTGQILKGEKLKSNESEPFDLTRSVPEKVGVFVDFDVGLKMMSTLELKHTFSAFWQKLRPPSPVVI